jgi:hypothetical protein
VNTILPALFTLAETYGTLAAETAATKAAGVVPLNVAVPVLIVDVRDVATILNEFELTNVVGTVVPVTSVAPIAYLSKI